MFELCGHSAGRPRRTPGRPFCCVLVVNNGSPLPTVALPTAASRAHALPTDPLVEAHALLYALPGPAFRRPCRVTSWGRAQFHRSMAAARVQHLQILAALGLAPKPTENVAEWIDRVGWLRCGRRAPRRRASWCFFPRSARRFASFTRLHSREELHVAPGL